MALTAVVSGGLISFLGVRNSREALEGQILADSQSQADLASEFARSYVEAVRGPLLKLVEAPGTKGAVEGRAQPELERSLNVMKAVMPAVQQIIIFDPEGGLVARGSSTAPPPANVADREWFVSVRGSRAPYLSLPSTSVATGKPIVSIILPVLGNDGVFLGVLNASISLEALTNSFSFLNNGPNQVTLVDRRQGGVVLAAHDIDKIMKPLNASEATRSAALFGDRTSLVASDDNGKQFPSAIAPVSDLPWTVVVSQSSDAAFASVNDLTRKSLFIAAAVIIIGCLFSGLVALQITRPLMRLRRAAQNLSLGQPGTRLNFRQRDEVGELGRAFDTMSQSLEERTTDLEDTALELRTAHDEMEVRVQERTAELAVTNAALRDSEESLRYIVDGARDYALMMLDVDGRVSKWTKGAERLLGYTAEEALGLDMPVFFTEEENEAGTSERLLKTACDHGSADFEGWRVRKDGTTFWGSVVLTAIRDEQGRLLGYSRIVRDITEKREAEERVAATQALFRGFVEMAADGIIIADASGHITVANRAAQAMFGYTQEQLLGRPVEDLLPASLRAQHENHRLGYHHDPQPRAMGAELELRGLRSDGRQFDAEVSLTPLKYDGSLSVAATVTDITERRRLERQVEQSVTELRRSNQELEHFAYVASHDLQEPLRMVSNYTQLLARRYKGRLDDNADDFIGFAVEGARRMQVLINDLLEYSRVSTKGKDFEPIEMETTLNRVLANLQVALQESGARVERMDLPAVIGDEAQVMQLLQNLIANAVKFRGDYTPVIEVGVEDQGTNWLFWVRDNGIGIEPQYFERIFVLFQRLHTRDEYEGTGIGLAICKRIVERHGGRIWVESASGQGTTFFFTLRTAGAKAAPEPDHNLVADVA